MTIKVLVKLSSGLVMWTTIQVASMPHPSIRSLLTFATVEEIIRIEYHEDELKETVTTVSSTKATSIYGINKLRTGFIDFNSH